MIEVEDGKVREVFLEHERCFTVCVIVNNLSQCVINQ